jgi:hypothetical protein
MSLHAIKIAKGNSGDGGPILKSFLSLSNPNL